MRRIKNYRCGVKAVETINTCTICTRFDLDLVVFFFGRFSFLPYFSGSVLILHVILWKKETKEMRMRMPFLPFTFTFTFIRVL